MLLVIVILLVISTVVVAAILYRVMGQREAAGGRLNRDDDEADVERLQSIRDYLRSSRDHFRFRSRCTFCCCSS